MDWPTWIHDGLIVLLAIIAGVGGLIAYERRSLHRRIDKHADELDKHVHEGIEVHRALERIETKLDMHMRNGGSHDNGDRHRPR